MVSGGSSVEEIPSIVLLCYLWLPFFLASICFERLLLHLCRRSNSMDSFDLNEDYTHLDDSFIPSTQFDKAENYDQSIHPTSATDAPRSALQSLTNVNFGLTPPPAPAPTHPKYSTLSIVHIDASAYVRLNVTDSHRHIFRSIMSHSVTGHFCVGIRCGPPVKRRL